MRTATVKVGDAEAVYDGEAFACDDESTANVLNSALAYYFGGGRLSNKLEYWPDPFADLARAIAEYCGGVLIAADPSEGPEPPEGTAF